MWWIGQSPDHDPIRPWLQPCWRGQKADTDWHGDLLHGWTTTRSPDLWPIGIFSTSISIAYRTIWFPSCILLCLLYTKLGTSESQGVRILGSWRQLITVKVQPCAQKKPVQGKVTCSRSWSISASPFSYLIKRCINTILDWCMHLFARFVPSLQAYSWYAKKWIWKRT